MGKIDTTGAAELHYDPHHHVLTFTHNGTKRQIHTVKPHSDSPKAYDGRLPAGRYLIAAMRHHHGHSGDWFDLHAESPDKGFYGYADNWKKRLETCSEWSAHLHAHHNHEESVELAKLREILDPQSSRGHCWGVHTGSQSLASVTVQDPEEWDHVKEYLNSGSLTYHGHHGKDQKFVGVLHVDA